MFEPLLFEMARALRGRKKNVEIVTPTTNPS